VREETSALLTALNKLDEAMTTVLLGLLENTLPASKQVAFGDLLIAAGELLQEHARAEQPAGIDDDSSRNESASDDDDSIQQS